jgi:hypothetical protein
VDDMEYHIKFSNHEKFLFSELTSL